MEYTATGLKQNLTKAEEQASLDRIYKYRESQEKAKKAIETGKIPVGTGVAPERDIAVLKGQAGAGIYRGGKPVTQESIKASSSQVKTGNPMQGSMWTPGATLPAQQGIGPGYQSAGVVNATIGAPLMKNAQGQIANPTGGNVMAPPSVMPPNTPASIETKAETYMRELRDYMKDIKDNRITVKTLNSA